MKKMRENVDEAKVTLRSVYCKQESHDWECLLQTNENRKRRMKNEMDEIHGIGYLDQLYPNVAISNIGKGC